MIKTVLGSLVFVAAAFALINLIGNVMVRPDLETVAHKAEMAAEKPAAKTPATKTPAAETPAAESEPDERAEQADHVAAVASDAGDVASGQKAFRKYCNSCHTTEKGGADRTGPNLWDIVGRDKASRDGFRYSNALTSMGGAWSDADLLSFIAGPRTFVPDTKMTFSGVKKEGERADLLAFLNTLKD